MADIDILLQLRGMRQSTEGLSKFQATMLRAREQVAQAGTIVSSFDGAMDQLNRTGTVSISTVAAFGSALPALINPVTAAATAVGLLVQQFIRMREEQKKLQTEAAGRSLAVINNILEEQIKIADAVIGSTGRMRKIKRDLAKEEFQLKEVIRLNTEQMEMNNARVEEGALTAAQATKANERLANRMLSSVVKIKTRIQGLREDARALEENRKAAEENARAQQGLKDQADQLVQQQMFQHELAALNGDTTELDRNLLVRQQLVETMTLQFNQEGTVNDQIADSIRLLDVQIERLQMKEQAMAAIGAMADQAIRGTAAGAFNALVNSIDDTISMQNLLSKSTGDALKNVLAQVLRQVGVEATIRAAMQTAKGFGQLAGGNVPGATLHFKSAALFAGVAVAAGTASAGLSSGSGGGGGSFAAPPQSPGNTGGFGGGRGGGQVIQQIILIGQLDAAGAEELHDQLAKARQTRDLGG